MEHQFGHDFSRVRIHADGPAGHSARAVSAQAYTVGSHIAFAPGRYNPDSTPGRRLLAHELAHVIQQGPAVPTAVLHIEDSRSTAEHEAEVAATRIEQQAPRGLSPAARALARAPENGAEGGSAGSPGAQSTGCRTTLSIPCDQSADERRPTPVPMDAYDLCNTGDCKLSVGGLGPDGKRLHPHHVLEPGECIAELNLPPASVSAAALCWNCMVGDRPGRGRLTFSCLCV
jgi:hypothetical protein